MARDEWPLLSVSVTHALGHVEQVLVLDHASTDGTAAGLEDLGRRFPGRLTVLRLEEGAFHQEAATSLMLEESDAASFDWVHVFDADEFVLPEAGRSLPDVLAEVGPEVDVVRYEVHNWVAPSDFDETDVASYDGLVQRSVPDPDLVPEYAADVATAVEEGSRSYFDVPFPSKVIFRGGRVLGLAAGAHLVRLPETTREAGLPPSTLRAAHVPFLTERRLDLRAAQGAALEAAGFSPEHGWQSWMLHRMQVAGTLPDFWRRHSVPEDPADLGEAGPDLVEDGALVAALAPTISLLCEEPAQPFEGPAHLTSDSVRTATALRALRTTQAALDAALAERDALAAERDGLLTQRDNVLAEREALVERHDAAVAAQHHLRGLVDDLNARRDALIEQSSRRLARLRRVRAQRDALEAELAGLRAPRRSLRRSRSAG